MRGPPACTTAKPSGEASQRSAATKSCNAGATIAIVVGTRESRRKWKPVSLTAYEIQSSSGHQVRGVPLQLYPGAANSAHNRSGDRVAEQPVRQQRADAVFGGLIGQ